MLDIAGHIPTVLNYEDESIADGHLETVGFSLKGHCLLNAFCCLFPRNEPVIGLAPMAGFTTPAFRGLAAHFGASYTVTELVSARGITYDRGLCRSLRYLAPPDTFPEVPFPNFSGTDNVTPDADGHSFSNTHGSDDAVLRTVEGEPVIKNDALLSKNEQHEHRQSRPWGIQLFGSEPTDFSTAIDMIFEEPELKTAAFIDINMGCPVPKVAREGAGAALMKNPCQCGRIVEAAVRAASRHGRFITVKIRLGMDQSSINAPLVAKTVVSAGAMAVTCHARTADQFYKGTADWSHIARVKEAVDVPVIGNGDLETAKDIVRMREITGCDGFAVGRAARGNPRLFMTLRRDLDLLSGHDDRGRCTTELNEFEIPYPRSDVDKDCDDQHHSECVDLTAHHSVAFSAEEWLQIMVAQLDATIERLGEAVGVREMRSSFAFYLKDFPGAAAFRRRVMEPVTRDGVVRVLREAANARTESIPGLRHS